MGTYTGAWKRATTDNATVRLKPDQDPEHANPTPNLGPVNWVADTIVPMIPAEWLGEQYTQLPTMTYVMDETPRDHADGGGVGHGMDTIEAQDERTYEHGVDYGATEARRWSPANTREGSYTVTVIEDNANEGNSPGYPQMRYDRGVGIGSDPHARVGKRIARWRDRTIDMHRWDAEGRASVARYAYSAPDQQAQTNGNQYTSPEPLYADKQGANGIGSPDQFVVPMARRSPRPWDESMTADGVNPSNAYGLTSWGL